MSDARFEDGVDKPLRLRAFEPDDVHVISALVQDAVFPSVEMRWEKSKRRFAILLNRFRWEDADLANAHDRPVERVQSVLAIEDVMGVKSNGVARDDSDLVLSLLSLAFHPGEDGMGQVILSLAGDGEISLDVEALEMTLRDVTRPYAAPSGKTPQHPV